MGGMPKEWKPPKEDADLFAQYKAHVEGERKLKPEMENAADRALADGATVGQLARHTGLTPEVFRRRARKLGIEHKRPPTVGPLKQEPAPAPAAVPDPVPTGPPEHLGISPEVAALTYEEARTLFVEAETKHMQWGITQRRHVARVPSEWRFHAGVQAGMEAGHIDLPERPVSGEETTT